MEKYLINNFDGENNKIIEIVSDHSCKGVLKKSENNNLKCVLSLRLNFGDLCSLTKFDRSCLKDLYVDLDYTPFMNGYNFQKEMEFLKQNIRGCEKIRVWSSHLDADDYLLLLYICYLFPEKNISVVFSEEFNWYCASISNMDEKEIKELEKREHILKSYEIKDYCRQWEEVIKENSELRYIENGVIKNLPIDYFDDEILNTLKDLGEVNIYKLIARLIINKVINNSGDTLYMYLIKRLIHLNKIKVLDIVDGREIITVN